MRNSTKSSERRPRGRPRAFDADVALGLASERFRAGGFSATSLDDLAEATGLNRPSLYSAFGDKRSLYLAALGRAITRAERGFDRLYDANLPMKAMLEQLFTAIVDGYLTGESGAGGCIAIGTAAAEAVGDADIRETLSAFIALEDRKVEALLRQAGSETPHAHATVVVAVIQSLSVRARAGATQEALMDAARDCIRVVAGI